MAAVLFPLCMLRDLTTIIQVIITKIPQYRPCTPSQLGTLTSLVCSQLTIHGWLVQINAWGVVSVIFILLFMTVQSLRRWVGDDMVSDNGVYDSSISQIVSDNLNHPKFSGMGTLCGMLGAGYFSHNALLPIVKNKIHSDTNTRDCSIAYALVLISYLIAGLLPSLVFDNEMKQHSDQQNFLLLDCFKHNGMAFAAQASLLIQLCTVWPLILGLIRSSIFEIFTGSVWPSTTRVVMLNVAYMGCSTLGTILLHKIVGTVLSYVAAVSGIIYIYFLPFLMTHRELTRVDNGCEMVEDALLADVEGVDTGEKMERISNADTVPNVQVKVRSRTWTLVVNMVVFACGSLMLVMPFVSKVIQSA